MSDQPPDQGSSGPPDRRALHSAYDDVVASFGRKPGAQPDDAEAGAGPGRGKDELLQAYDQVVEREATRPEWEAVREPEPSWLRKYGAASVGVVCLLASLAIWIVKPAYLFPRYQAPSAYVTDAEARNAMIAAALYVEEFYDREGRLPRSAAEAAIDSPGVNVEDLGRGRYLLRVEGPGRTFVLEGRVGGAP